MKPATLSDAKDERPVFLIIAGPNGSGKSSAYQGPDAVAIERLPRIINPDLLSARIREVERLGPAEANLQAVIRIESWLETSILAEQSVGVETVLSTPKYRRLVILARSLGFEIRLNYVVLESPQLNVERVRRRVESGGHSVAEDKIIERYARSLEQLPWFLDQADRAWIYDNSGNEPRLICQKGEGVITLDQDALPQIAAAVRSIEPA